MVDGGAFEERHRDRQRFDELGNKAEVTVKEYRDQFPNVRFTSHGFYLTEANIGTIIMDGHFVFCCGDNHLSPPAS